MQKFEPDQLVLIRESEKANWDLARYSYCSVEQGQDYIHHIQGLRWFRDNEIIPYFGNENLLGTTDIPEPKWEPKQGELVAVKNSSSEKWKVRVFCYHDHANGFVCDSEIEREAICFWRHCEPLRKHFNIPKE